MSTELTKQDDSKSLRGLINSSFFKSQVAAALPRHMTPDRMIRVACNAMIRAPKLEKCTKESFINCLLSLSAMGLEPDGRRAHLIPFENKRAGTVECTLIVDWKGLVELALRSGQIAKLHADVICENDEFDYDLGEIKRHKIDFRQPRGNPFAAYAMAETKDGARFFQVMTRDEIEGIRDGSQGYKSAVKYGGDSPWTTAPNEMWKKTVVRRLSKWLPLTPELQNAVEYEDEEKEPKQANGREINEPSEMERKFAAPALDDQKPATKPTAKERRESKAAEEKPDPKDDFLRAMTEANIEWVKLSPLLIKADQISATEGDWDTLREASATNLLKNFSAVEALWLAAE